MKGIIYIITNIYNSKCYIGSTAHYKQRQYKHQWLMNNNKGVKKMRDDIIEYGANAFVFSILEQVEDISTLRKKEDEWIKRMDTINTGYNYNRANNPSYLKNPKCIECGKLMRGNLSRSNIQVCFRCRYARPSYEHVYPLLVE